jgi:hypothetical protein
VINSNIDNLAMKVKKAGEEMKRIKGDKKKKGGEPSSVAPETSSEKQR